MTKQDEGLRANEGKLRWDLVTPEFEELVAVFHFGSQKYSDHNWLKGMKWSKMFASMMRHIWKWFRGEDRDEESGLHHMAHVAWNALALVTYDKYKIGEDDRYFKKLKT